MRGGAKSSAWKPGQAPVKKKGTKHKRTVLKEKIGLKNWETLTSYIEGDGAGKLVEEMRKLNGRDYVIAYGQLAEFVKPKLARTTLIGDPNKPIFSQPLTDDQVEKILSKVK